MSWLNYHHLHYFWTVAKLQSFTKAAQELRISQSAVSFQVSQPEDFLGKKLLIRSTSKKISLTEEGQIIFSQAEEIFRQGRELVDGIKNIGAQSRFHVGAIGSLSKNLQIRLLKSVIERNDFELTVDIGDQQTLLQRLLTFKLDAILCDVPYPHSEDEPLVQREIAKEPICLIAQKAKPNLSLSERLTRDGIYLPARSNPITSELEDFLKVQKQKVKIKGYIDDIALLRLLSLETNSLVAIPKVGAAREIASKSVVVQHEFKSLFQRFYLVLRKKSPRTQKLLELLGQI